MAQRHQLQVCKIASPLFASQVPSVQLVNQCVSVCVFGCVCIRAPSASISEVIEFGAQQGNHNSSRTIAASLPPVRRRIRVQYIAAFLQPA